MKMCSRWSGSASSTASGGWRATRVSCPKTSISAPSIISGWPLLAIRGGDGQVRSFVNVCSHRGAKLVNEVSGNARQVQCFYHHWTYDPEGNCIGIPRAQAYEASGLDQENCGLREVRTEVRHGLVFFNLDRDCKPLDEHLGRRSRIDGAGPWLLTSRSSTSTGRSSRGTGRIGRPRTWSPTTRSCTPWLGKPTS